MATPTSSKQPRQPTEMLQIIGSCMGALAMLAGIVPDVATGPIGRILMGGTALAASIHLLLAWRLRTSLGRAMLEILVVGACFFALIYGCMWYFTVYLMSQPLFTVGPQG